MIANQGLIPGDHSIYLGLYLGTWTLGGLGSYDPFGGSLALFRCTSKEPKVGHTVDDINPVCIYIYISIFRTTISLRVLSI